MSRPPSVKVLLHRSRGEETLRRPKSAAFGSDAAKHARINACQTLLTNTFLVARKPLLCFPEARVLSYGFSLTAAKLNVTLDCVSIGVTEWYLLSTLAQSDLEPSESRARTLSSGIAQPPPPCAVFLCAAYIDQLIIHSPECKRHIPHEKSEPWPSTSTGKQNVKPVVKLWRDGRPGEPSTAERVSDFRRRRGSGELQILGEDAESGVYPRSLGASANASFFWSLVVGATDIRQSVYIVVNASSWCGVVVVAVAECGDEYDPYLWTDDAVRIGNV
ncbi:hypothetical protein EDB92DRAFT_1995163 [Lactarius akahatsu]|uniref:Uncharacterized protein n=1 Tax=Lactarius akahatsu TaxID=416441 RepID=A0AAD4Q7A2_9AGAM|nr:hypothetical protein EDB92DRAFT_1995163 [Lactarius akahatsu]